MTREYTTSKALPGKHPCPLPNCTSSNAVSYYPDGSGFCFSCLRYISIRKEYAFSVEKVSELKALPDCFQALRLEARNISQATCEFYNYLQGYYKGQPTQAALYHTPQGDLCAQKYRFANKEFLSVGNIKRAGLFGQPRFSPNPKIAVVVTEGEIDALSIAELQQCKWPVVSIRNGAPSAHKDIAEQIEWLSGWKHVILCFDNDEAGKKAVEKCVPLFESGKVKVALLPLKDANAMLVAGRYKELEQALWSAQLYRPDYIECSSDVPLDFFDKVLEPGFSLPYPHLEYKLHGLLKGEMLLVAAGSGMGKTAFVKELAYWLVIHHGCKVGNIFLEESRAETKNRYLALDNNVAYADLCPVEGIRICETMTEETKAWRAQFNLQIKEKYASSNWQPKELTKEQKRATHSRLFAKGKFKFFNHEGCRTLDNIISRITYLAVGEKCDFIILDTINSLVSGLMEKQNNIDVIDALMRELDALRVRTHVTFIVVTQLSKDKNKACFNEGGRITMADLRGSVQLAAVPTCVVGIEGNQQDETKGLFRQLRVLKARTGAKLGLAGSMLYNEQTGRLLPVLDPITSNPAQNLAIRNSFE